MRCRWRHLASAALATVQLQQPLRLLPRGVLELRLLVQKLRTLGHQQPAALEGTCRRRERTPLESELRRQLTPQRVDRETWAHGG